MWSNRNKINTGQSERVCEKEMLFTVCKFMIKYWIDFVQFLFLLCILSFLKLICVPQSPQKVLLSVAAAVLRPSYLLHISYLHIPPPPSRDISTKRFPTTNLLFVNQPLIFLWVQKFLWFLQNVLSKTWLFKSKVNIRRSMLIRKGKLRKYHLQLVRRKLVLWSQSLLPSADIITNKLVNRTYSFFYEATFCKKRVQSIPLILCIYDLLLQMCAYFLHIVAIWIVHRGKWFC